MGSLPSSAKPTKVKAWPELRGLHPIIPVVREANRGSPGIKSAIEIDFGSVRAVSSSGLAIFLLRLLRLSEGRTIHILKDCSPKMRQQMENVGLFDLINSAASNTQEDLALDSSRVPLPPQTVNHNVNLPLYRMSFPKGGKRRASVQQFVNWLSTHLTTIDNSHKVSTNGLIMLFNEIAKNSADHSSQDAIFGLDMHDIDDSRTRLSFTFGDFGIGIKRHIEKFLPPEAEKRRMHMSLYEAYRLALMPCYTSNRSSGLNKGHGMSIIIDCAIDLGMELSIFDASSRGVLNEIQSLEKATHHALRRIFHNVGHDVGFFYYGELTIGRK